jgi:primosomal protein N' (replication factor Y)
MNIVLVALPIPKRQLFEYQLGEHKAVPGVRVRVPFGPRKLIGVVIECKNDAVWDKGKLKVVEQVLDDEPLFSAVQLKLCLWLSQYYQHPLGEVLATAMPVALRKGEPSQIKAVNYWRLSELGRSTEADSLGKAVKQGLLFALLQQGECSEAELREETTTSVRNALEKKGLIESFAKTPEVDLHWQQTIKIGQKPLANVEQALAITGIEQQLGGFATFLLEGVTGSGKTEVYLQSIESVLAKGRQVLILVPEIGLTPQTVQRFRQRFGLAVGVLHSNLTDAERLVVWQQSRTGQLAMVIGTRSAIFTPMLRPGMIIVDEEHDGSYKQQDGLRYHARDLAVMRAREENIPLLLGSATPSLESLNNALSGKYQHFILQHRAANALHAKQQVHDIRNQNLQTGLSSGMLERVEQHLKQGSQVMLFINRRGYAPAMLCHQCGFAEECKRCNRPYTVHKQLNRLQCHHCGSAKAIPRVCKECGSEELLAMGVGTEQLEQNLAAIFPRYATVRIDSDSARGKTRLHELLDKVNQNHYQILIGTQILSKGHHFPNVTLVVILDVDGALFSADYRAAEHLAQLITQLAGRAGRAEKPGEMWLQTHNPAHPLLQDLIHNGYGHFARFALLERKQAALPPHSFQALFRSEAIHARQAHEFLQQVSQLFDGQTGILCLGPLPALMEKRQGRYRMQLLLQGPHRGQLQQVLAAQMSRVESLPLANKVRWSIDVDPQDFS